MIRRCNATARSSCPIADFDRYVRDLEPERDFEVVNPESDPRYREIRGEYYRIMARKGVTPTIAQAEIRRNPTLIGAMLLRRGEADALIAGQPELVAATT